MTFLCKTEFLCIKWICKGAPLPVVKPKGLTTKAIIGIKFKEI